MSGHDPGWVDDRDLLGQDRRDGGRGRLDHVDERALTLMVFAGSNRLGFDMARRLVAHRGADELRHILARSGIVDDLSDAVGHCFDVILLGIMVGHGPSPLQYDRGRLGPVH